MGVASTNTIAYKLVASGSILDLFDDEDILVSDNITGLFDIGTLPVDFSRTIILPATKKNNAFFEHVYDISVDSPYLFSTNVKVPAYLDFDGIYLTNGYLQLNKVNLKGDLGILSYEVSLFGTVSSFARDMNKNYLTDLSVLDKYNHTSSIANISSSWGGGLFNGDIVYPLADYGKGFKYTSGDLFFGIDDNEGSLQVQDFKPAIRVKKVWDACFEQFGYTYTGSFWDQSWLDDVYMICNNNLKYPVYSGVNLEGYGNIKIGPISGSGQTSLLVPSGTVTNLPWYNVQKDTSDVVGVNSSYFLPISSSLRGVINLEIQLSGSLAGPAPYLYVRETGSLTNDSVTTLVNLSQYFSASVMSKFASGETTQNEVVSVQTEFTTALLPGPRTYYFGLEWVSQFNAPYNNFTFVLDPNDKPKSYLEIKEVRNAADDRIMDIPNNMPYGTNGIKLIDWIKGIQKKFNLVIYPNKTKPNQMIVETFNTFYKRGVRKDFNKYINLNEPVEVVPANNLAVNKLSFGDAVDQDYLSQQFSKAENRPFGTAFYTDTTNYFSQGELKVETTFGASPLLYLQGTGLSGSVAGATPEPESSYAYPTSLSAYSTTTAACSHGGSYQTLWATKSGIAAGIILHTDYGRTTPFNGNYSYYKVYDYTTNQYYYGFIGNNGTLYSYGNC